MIALLEEHQHASVEQAITGQIDVRTGKPYAAYKDSGVERLPRVPPDWERHRLKTLLEGVDKRSSTGSETLLSLRRDHGIVVYADHFNRPPQAKSGYLSGLLRTAPCRAHFRRESTGLGTGTAGFLRLYDDSFLATTVYLPAKAMQRRILNWIDLTTAKTTGRGDRTAHQIGPLREYRQRLIDDAVTGKLDVRGAAAALPELDPPADDPA